MRPGTGAQEPATVIGIRSISSRLSPTFHVTSSPAVPHPGTSSAESSVYCPGALTLTGYAMIRLAVTLDTLGNDDPFSPDKSSARFGLVCVNATYCVTLDPSIRTVTSLVVSTKPLPPARSAVNATPVQSPNVPPNAVNVCVTMTGSHTSVRSGKTPLELTKLHPPVKPGSWGHAAP